MGLVVAVAAVNVSSSVLMLVLERRQEIGILKASAPARAPSGSFLIAALVTGWRRHRPGLGPGCWLAVNINGLLAGRQIGR